MWPHSFRISQAITDYILIKHLPLWFGDFNLICLYLTITSSQLRWWVRYFTLVFSFTINLHILTKLTNYYVDRKIFLIFSTDTNLLRYQLGWILIVQGRWFFVVLEILHSERFLLFWWPAQSFEAYKRLKMLEQWRIGKVRNG